MRSTNAINYSRPLRYSDPPPAPWPEWRPAPALDFGFADTITINADGLRITDAPRKSSTENFVGHLDAFLAETEAFKVKRRRKDSGTTEDGMMDLDQFLDEAMHSDAGQSPIYEEFFPTVRRNDVKFTLPAAQPRVSFVTFAPPAPSIRPSLALPLPPPVYVYKALAPSSTNSLTPTSSISSSTTIRRRTSLGGLTAKLFKRGARTPSPANLDIQLDSRAEQSFFPGPQLELPPDITDWLGSVGSRSPSMQTHSPSMSMQAVEEHSDAEQDLYMSDPEDAAPVSDIVRFLNARTELWDSSRPTIVVGEQGQEVEFEMVGDAHGVAV